MTKTRHLSDLYLIGKEEILDDGKGEIRVWVQKLNGTESELARRKADAQRARLLSLRSQPDSDAYLAAVGEAYDSIDRDYLVAILLGPEAYKRRQVRQSEVAFEEEWAKDGYLQGLHDVWRSSLAEEFALDSEDPEALRVFRELSRYNDAVTSRVEADLADHRDELMSLSVEDLQRRVAEQYLKDAGTLVWMTEFRKCAVLYGVRKPDPPHARYFDNRAEVDELQTKILLDLYDAIDALTVDPLEGKDSPETLSSSPQPELPGEEVTEESSGLVAAAR